MILKLCLGRGGRSPLGSQQPLQHYEDVGRLRGGDQWGLPIDPESICAKALGSGQTDVVLGQRWGLKCLV